MILAVEEVISIARRDRRFNLFEREAGRFADGAIVPVMLAASNESTGGESRYASALDAFLVWGHHVLSGAADGDGDRHRNVPVVIVDATSSPLELLRLALATENRAGRYRWSELDRILALFESLCDPGFRDNAGILPLLEPDRDVTPQVRKYRTLSPVLRTALDAGALDVRTAERIATIDPAVIEPLVESARDLTFSRRRQYLLACRDLLDRGDPPEELLTALNSAPPVQRFDLVMKRRKPRRERMDAVVDRVRHEVLRGTGVTLQPPANYEGERYRITFEAGSPGELRRRLNAAAKLENYLDELLGILFQDPLDDTLE